MKKKKIMIKNLKIMKNQSHPCILMNPMKSKILKIYLIGIHQEKGNNFI